VVAFVKAYAVPLLVFTVTLIFGASLPVPAVILMLGENAV